MQIEHEEESCALGATSSPQPSDASATLATAAPARFDVTPAAAESPDESLPDLLQQHAANLLQQLDAEGEIPDGLPVKVGRDTPSVCCCSAAPLVHLPPPHIKLLMPAPHPNSVSMPRSSTSALRSRSDRSSVGAGPLTKTRGMSQSGCLRCGGCLSAACCILAPSDRLRSRLRCESGTPSWSRSRAALS